MTSPAPLYSFEYNGTGDRYRGCETICTLFSLIETVYSTEHSFPTYLAVEKAVILVKGEPYEQCLSYNVVFGNESPITRVGTIVTVVTHHPVVIHLECVAVGLLAVDVDSAVFIDFKAVSFIYGNRAFLYGKVLERKLYLFSLLWNPYRAVVVGCPTIVAVEGINAFGCVHLHDFNALAQACVALEPLIVFLG